MTQLRLDHYRDMIIRAVKEGGVSLDLLAAHMDDAAQAKQILQVKGYGSAWSSMTRLAALVPNREQK
ncbi:hypothetical protein AB4Z19_15520 [Pseudoduganella sp. RAF19]|uniref:hypothetical protein n=1 Tax=Bacteria TaxID=2 RepID=UPI003F989B7F